MIEQVRALSGTRQTPGVGFARQKASEGLAAISSLFGDDVPETQDQAGPASEMRLAEMPSLYVREGEKPTRAALMAMIHSRPDDARPIQVQVGMA